MGRRRETMLFLGVLAAGVALRAVFFTGLILQDDASYAMRAVALSHGAMGPPTSYFQARIGLVGPTALFYSALGVNPIASAAFTFLCSVGSSVVAFFLGRALWGARAALLAAAALAVFPLDVLGASQLFANAPLALLVGASVGLFLLAERRGDARLHLAGGLALGLAAVVHETALLCVVFYPAYLLIVARPTRRHLLVLAGIVIGLAVDPLIHGLLMGDPNARLAALRGAQTAGGTAADVDYRGFNAQWLLEPIVRLATEQELGLHAWMVAAVCAVRLFRPRIADQRTLALFVAVVAAWMLYGTLSPTTYAPLARVPRYLAPLTLPAMWLLGLELDRRRPRTQAAALAILAASGILCVAADGGRAVLGPFEAAHDVLAREPTARIVAEPKMIFPLRYVDGFRAAPDIERLDPGHDPRAALVVVSDPDARRRVAALPGAVRVASMTPPRSIYQRLLRSGPVIALLRLTRPAYRVADLERKAALSVALEIYRVP